MIYIIPPKIVVPQEIVLRVLESTFYIQAIQFEAEWYQWGNQTLAVAVIDGFTTNTPLCDVSLIYAAYRTEKGTQGAWVTMWVQGRLMDTSMIDNPVMSGKYVHLLINLLKEREYTNYPIR